MTPESSFKYEIGKGNNCVILSQTLKKVRGNAGVTVIQGIPSRRLIGKAELLGDGIYRGKISSAIISPDDPALLGFIQSFEARMKAQGIEERRETVKELNSQINKDMRYAHEGSKLETLRTGLYLSHALTQLKRGKAKKPIMVGVLIENSIRNCFEAALIEHVTLTHMGIENLIERGMFYDRTRSRDTYHYWIRSSDIVKGQEMYTCVGYGTWWSYERAVDHYNIRIEDSRMLVRPYDSI